MADDIGTTADLFEPYFTTDHNGYPMGAFTIVTAHEYVETYVCGGCYALTTQPGPHAKWHREVLNGSQS